MKFKDLSYLQKILLVSKTAILVIVFQILISQNFASATSILRTPQNVTSSLKPISRPPKSFTELQKKTSCMESDFCGHYQLFSRLWAQEVVMADLMVKQMNEWGIKAKTNMGIIDSGLNYKILSYVDQGFVRPPIQLPYKRLFSDESMTEDQLGHGTMIYGLTEGRFGVGIYPTGRSTVYKMDMQGRYFAGNVNGASLKACEDGNEVIIHALGSHQEQVNGSALEQHLSSHLTELNKRGCIIVKSAGNDRVREDQQKFKSDFYDNFHRVAAMSPKDYLANFSSDGEVAAPGESVFSIKNKDYFAPMCNGVQDQHFGQINGTSFAGPIYGEILQAVLDVLMVNHVSLSPQEFIKRNALAVRIMRASRVQARFGEIGNINGLIAIHIAKVWQDWNTKSLAQIESTNEENLRLSKNQGASSELCSDPLQDYKYLNCVNDGVQCSERCKLDSLKRHNVLCEKPNPLLAGDLIELFLKKGDIVGAYRIKGAKVRSESKIIEALVKAFEKRFNTPDAITEFNRALSLNLRTNQVDSQYRKTISEANSMVRYLTEWLFDTGNQDLAENYDFFRLTDEIIKITNIKTKLSGVIKYAVTQLVDKFFSENRPYSVSRDEALKRLFLTDLLPDGYIMSRTRGMSFDHRHFLFPKLYDHFRHVENGGLTKLTENELRLLRVELVKRGYFLFIGTDGFYMDEYIESLTKNSILNGDKSFSEIKALHQFEPLRYYTPSFRHINLRDLSPQDEKTLVELIGEKSIFGKY